ncbi:MAG: hypothetical protein H0W25_00020 [Acidimicrobiia bacterium]|nr:hypothetical protein [Acidimicrobiia bacterium]
MVLWWIGNAVLAFVVLPLVVFLANRLVRLSLEVKRYADDVLEHGVGLTGTLDAVPKLVHTGELTAAARGLVGRYGAALSILQSGQPAAARRPARSVRLAPPRGEG